MTGNESSKNMEQSEKSVKVLEYIEKEQSILWPQLSVVLGREFLGNDEHGYHSYSIAKNVRLWTHMSLETIQIMAELYENQLIHFTPIDVECYKTLGIELQLPVVYDDDEHDVPSWFPMSIDFGPEPGLERIIN